MSESQLLSFLTSPLGKLHVASNNSNAPHPTLSKKNHYGLEHVNRVSQTWPEFTYTEIKKMYAHILDTLTRYYTPQAPVHFRSVIHSEQDFVEHFKQHFEQSINHALDVTFSAPALIAIRDLISSIEGSPKDSQNLIRVLPLKTVARILDDQYGWNISTIKDITDIKDTITRHFKVRPRSRDDDQVEADSTVNKQTINRQDIYYLVALALRNILSQYFIPETLFDFVAHGNNRPLLDVIKLLPLDVKLKHTLAWIDDDPQVDHLHRVICPNTFGRNEFTILFNLLPAEIQELAKKDMSTKGLDLIFAGLPSPLDRHRYFGGQGDFEPIRMVPTGAITLYEQLNPDLASTVQPEPHRNILPGEFKISKNWKPDWDESSHPFQEAVFWHAISQVQCYTYQYRVRYGYIISDAGLRCFWRVAKKDHSGREISKHGHVELSLPINWDDSHQQLTIMLAVWYLHMLVAEGGNNLPNELWVQDKFNPNKLVFCGRRDFIDDPTFGHGHTRLPQPGPNRRQNRTLLG